MEKYVYYNELFLIYKDLLSDKSKDIFNLYYGENLTMQEIADIQNISKSRVGIIVKNIEKELDNYEKVLKMNSLYSKLNDLLNINDIDIIKKEITKIVKED